MSAQPHVSNEFCFKLAALLSPTTSQHHQLLLCEIRLLYQLSIGLPHLGGMLSMWTPGPHLLVGMVKNTRMDGWMDGCMDAWMGAWMDGWISSWMDDL